MYINKFCILFPMFCFCILKPSKSAVKRLPPPPFPFFLVIHSQISKSRVTVRSQKSSCSYFGAIWKKEIASTKMIMQVKPVADFSDRPEISNQQPV